MPADVADRAGRSTPGQEFLADGGEMGALTRAFDWTTTPLGPPEAWPQSLKTVVRVLLNSRHPMFIWWGPELIQFYNDAYRQTMGPERHPSALGQPGRECWEEIWPIIGPQIEHVMDGRGATWNEDQLVPVTRFGARRDVWWTYGYSPIDDGDGHVGGVLVVCNDVTEQHLARERLYDLFRQAPGFIAVLRGDNHTFDIANAAYLRLVANRDILGKPVAEALPEVVEQGFITILDKVVETGEAFSAKALPIQLLGETGELEQRYLDFVYQPIRGDEARPTGIFVQGYDVTEQQRALAQREMLSAELAHRVKNTLAVVSALIQQTFGSTHSNAEARAILIGRVAALGQAHDLLAETSWRAAPLLAVAEAALRPHQTGDSRIRIDGPPVWLAARQAMSVAMALHELATNAVKYGALSGADGTVDLSWAIEGDKGAEKLRLTWRERAARPITVPSRKGFGTRLIEQTLSSDLRAVVRIEYPPDGVVCEVLADLDGLKLTGT